MYNYNALALGIAVALGVPNYAVAEESAPAASEAAAATIPAPDGSDTATLGEVVVTALPFDETQDEIATPVTVLDQDDLRRKRAASLGDTLSGELGVTSSYFGPGAGRPIIRGLDGPRIRVLEGGIGTNDLSTISPDHQVTTETLNAKQVEILRGPATLLYGSGASGGIVNVVTDRIPQAIPANGLEGNAEVRGNSVSDERTFGGNLTGGAGHFAWHLDGFSRKTGDYDIPGRAIRNDPDSPRGVLKNSDIDSHGLSAGASLLGERGFVGLSVTALDSNYGIPTEELARIDLTQTRYDLDSELDQPVPGFDRLKFRLGYSDYQHKELESTGEVGTMFKNKTTEGRLELLHSPLGAWQGTLGVQFTDRDFSALGEESVVPQTHADTVGLFLVEQRDWNRWHFDLGIRGERATNEPVGDNPARNFNSVSLSAGTIWKFVDGYALGLSLTRAERAPQIEELYSNGPHGGTAAFEIGDANLSQEISNNLDLSLRKTAGRITGKVGIFANRIDNFIYEQFSDNNGDGVADQVGDDGEFDPDGELRLSNFTNADADFYGAEAEAIIRVLDRGADQLDVRLFADSVRGALRSGGNLPRITPLRFGVHGDYTRGPWQAGAGLTRFARQDQTADLETPTAGYTLFDADLSYTFRTGRARTSLFLQGNNLLDEEARVHTSFLKDQVPLPGRAIVVGIRTTF